MDNKRKKVLTKYLYRHTHTHTHTHMHSQLVAELGREASIPYFSFFIKTLLL